jgi:hypothetical protein
MAMSEHSNTRAHAVRILLGIALVTAGCEPTPPADQASLDEPGEHPVADAAELSRMQQHIDSLYEQSDVVHRFTTASGDAIDCVDIRRQPSLRRPEMRGHTLEMAPRTIPAEPAARVVVPPVDDGNAARRPLAAEQEVVLHGGYDATGAERRCPEGSVPVLRLTLATMKSFRTLEDFHRKAPLHLDPGAVARESELDARPGQGQPGLAAARYGASAYHQYAHAGRSVKNMGAEAYLNLWSPHTSSSSEFSLSQIWVTRGTGSWLESVEAGWQVFRGLYGDDNARLFIYSFSHRIGSCYNLTCSGFVQTDNTVVLGGKFTSYSTTDGQQLDLQLMWYKDGADGHWWLRCGTTWVGYYPRTRFDSAGLADHADRVDFGGEIIDASGYNVHTQTDMGSGAYADQGWQKAAYQRNIRYLDTSSAYQDAPGLTASNTDPWCYNIQLSNGAGAWGTYFYFGGTGYNTQCQ